MGGACSAIPAHSVAPPHPHGGGEANTYGGDHGAPSFAGGNYPPGPGGVTAAGGGYKGVAALQRQQQQQQQQYPQYPMPVPGPGPVIVNPLFGGPRAGGDGSVASGSSAGAVGGLGSSMSTTTPTAFFSPGSPQPPPYGTATMGGSTHSHNSSSHNNSGSMHFAGPNPAAVQHPNYNNSGSRNRRGGSGSGMAGSGSDAKYQVPDGGGGPPAVEGPPVNARDHGISETYQSYFYNENNAGGFGAGSVSGGFGFGRSGTSGRNASGSGGARSGQQAAYEPRGSHSSRSGGSSRGSNHSNSSPSYTGQSGQGQGPGQQRRHYRRSTGGSGHVLGGGGPPPPPPYQPGGSSGSTPTAAAGAQHQHQTYPSPQSQQQQQQPIPASGTPNNGSTAHFGGSLSSSRRRNYNFIPQGPIAGLAPPGLGIADTTAGPAPAPEADDPSNADVLAMHLQQPSGAGLAGSQALAGSHQRRARLVNFEGSTSSRDENGGSQIVSTAGPDDGPGAMASARGGHQQLPHFALPSSAPSSRTASTTVIEAPPPRQEGHVSEGRERAPTAAPSAAPSGAQPAAQATMDPFVAQPIDLSVLAGGAQQGDFFEQFGPVVRSNSCIDGPVPAAPRPAPAAPFAEQSLLGPASPPGGLVTAKPSSILLTRTHYDGPGAAPGDVDRGPGESLSDSVSSMGAAPGGMSRANSKYIRRTRIHTSVAGAGGDPGPPPSPKSGNTNANATASATVLAIDIPPGINTGGGSGGGGGREPQTPAGSQGGRPGALNPTSLDLLERINVINLCHPCAVRVQKKQAKLRLEHFIRQQQQQLAGVTAQSSGGPRVVATGGRRQQSADFSISVQEPPEGPNDGPDTLDNSSTLSKSTASTSSHLGIAGGKRDVALRRRLHRQVAAAGGTCGGTSPSPAGGSPSNLRGPQPAQCFKCGRFIIHRRGSTSSSNTSRYTSAGHAGGAGTGGGHRAGGAEQRSSHSSSSSQGQPGHPRRFSGRHNSASYSGGNMVGSNRGSFVSSFRNGSYVGGVSTRSSLTVTTTSGSINLFINSSMPPTGPGAAGSNRPSLTSSSTIRKNSNSTASISFRGPGAALPHTAPPLPNHHGGRHAGAGHHPHHGGPSPEPLNQSINNILSMMLLSGEDPAMRPPAQARDGGAPTPLDLHALAHFQSVNIYVNNIPNVILAVNSAIMRLPMPRTRRQMAFLFGLAPNGDAALPRDLWADYGLGNERAVTAAAVRLADPEAAPTGLLNGGPNAVSESEDALMDSFDADSASKKCSPRTAGYRMPDAPPHPSSNRSVRSIAVRAEWDARRRARARRSLHRFAQQLAAVRPVATTYITRRTIALHEYHHARLKLRQQQQQTSPTAAGGGGFNSFDSRSTQSAHRRPSSVRRQREEALAAAKVSRRAVRRKLAAVLDPAALLASPAGVAPSAASTALFSVGDAEWFAPFAASAAATDKANGMAALTNTVMMGALLVAIRHSYRAADTAACTLLAASAESKKAAPSPAPAAPAAAAPALAETDRFVTDFFASGDGALAMNPLLVGALGDMEHVFEELQRGLRDRYYQQSLYALKKRRARGITVMAPPTVAATAGASAHAAAVGYPHSLFDLVFSGHYHDQQQQCHDSLHNKADFTFAALHRTRKAAAAADAGGAEAGPSSSSPVSPGSSGSSTSDDESTVRPLQRSDSFADELLGAGSAAAAAQPLPECLGAPVDGLGAARSEERTSLSTILVADPRSGQLTTRRVFTTLDLAFGAGGLTAAADGSDVFNESLNSDSRSIVVGSSPARAARLIKQQQQQKQQLQQAMGNTNTSSSTSNSRSPSCVHLALSPARPSPTQPLAPSRLNASLLACKLSFADLFGDSATGGDDDGHVGRRGSSQRPLSLRGAVRRAAGPSAVAKDVMVQIISGMFLRLLDNFYSFYGLEGAESQQGHGHADAGAQPSTDGPQLMTPQSTAGIQQIIVERFRHSDSASAAAVRLSALHYCGVLSHPMYNPPTAGPSGGHPSHPQQVVLLPPPTPFAAPERYLLVPLFDRRSRFLEDASERRLHRQLYFFASPEPFGPGPAATRPLLSRGRGASESRHAGPSKEPLDRLKNILLYVAKLVWHEVLTSKRVAPALSSSSSTRGAHSQKGSDHSSAAQAAGPSTGRFFAHLFASDPPSMNASDVQAAVEGEIEGLLGLIVRLGDGNRGADVHTGTGSFVGSRPVEGPEPSPSAPTGPRAALVDASPLAVPSPLSAPDDSCAAVKSLVSKKSATSSSVIDGDGGDDAVVIQAFLETMFPLAGKYFSLFDSGTTDADDSGLRALPTDAPPSAAKCSLHSSPDLNRLFAAMFAHTASTPSSVEGRGGAKAGRDGAGAGESAADKNLLEAVAKVGEIDLWAALFDLLEDRGDQSAALPPAAPPARDAATAHDGGQGQQQGGGSGGDGSTKRKHRRSGRRAPPPLDRKEEAATFFYSHTKNTVQHNPYANNPFFETDGWSLRAAKEHASRDWERNTAAASPFYFSSAFNNNTSLLNSVVTSNFAKGKDSPSKAGKKAGTHPDGADGGHKGGELGKSFDSSTASGGTAHAVNVLTQAQDPSPRMAASQSQSLVDAPAAAGTARSSRPREMSADMRSSTSSINHLIPQSRPYYHNAHIYYGAPGSSSAGPPTARSNTFAAAAAAATGPNSSLAAPIFTGTDSIFALSASSPTLGARPASVASIVAPGRHHRPSATRVGRQPYASVSSLVSPPYSNVHPLHRLAGLHGDDNDSSGSPVGSPNRPGPPQAHAAALAVPPSALLADDPALRRFLLLEGCADDAPMSTHGSAADRFAILANALASDVRILFSKAACALPAPSTHDASLPSSYLYMLLRAYCRNTPDEVFAAALDDSLLFRFKPLLHFYHSARYFTPALPCTPARQPESAGDTDQDDDRAAGLLGGGWDAADVLSDDDLHNLEELPQAAWFEPWSARALMPGRLTSAAQVVFSTGVPRPAVTGNASASPPALSRFSVPDASPLRDHVITDRLAMRPFHPCVTAGDVFGILPTATTVAADHETIRAVVASSARPANTALLDALALYHATAAAVTDGPQRKWSAQMTEMALFQGGLSPAGAASRIRWSVSASSNTSKRPSETSAQSTSIIGFAPRLQHGYAAHNPLTASIASLSLTQRAGEWHSAPVSTVIPPHSMLLLLTSATHLTNLLAGGASAGGLLPPQHSRLSASYNHNASSTTGTSSSQNASSTVLSSGSQQVPPMRMPQLRAQRGSDSTAANPAHGSALDTGRSTMTVSSSQTHVNTVSSASLSASNPKYLRPAPSPTIATGGTTPGRDSKRGSAGLPQTIVLDDEPAHPAKPRSTHYYYYPHVALRRSVENVRKEFALHPHLSQSPAAATGRAAAGGLGSHPNTFSLGNNSLYSDAGNAASQAGGTGPGADAPPLLSTGPQGPAAGAMHYNSMFYRSSFFRDGDRPPAPSTATATTTPPATAQANTLYSNIANATSILLTAPAGGTSLQHGASTNTTASSHGHAINTANSGLQLSAFSSPTVSPLVALVPASPAAAPLPSPAAAPSLAAVVQSNLDVLRRAAGAVAPCADCPPPLPLNAPDPMNPHGGSKGSKGSKGAPNRSTGSRSGAPAATAAGGDGAAAEVLPFSGTVACSPSYVIASGLNPVLSGSSPFVVAAAEGLPQTLYHRLYADYAAEISDNFASALAAVQTNILKGSPTPEATSAVPSGEGDGPSGQVSAPGHLTEHYNATPSALERFTLSSCTQLPSEGATSGSGAAPACHSTGREDSQSPSGYLPSEYAVASSTAAPAYFSNFLEGPAQSGAAAPALTDPRGPDASSFMCIPTDESVAALCDGLTKGLGMAFNTSTDRDWAHPAARSLGAGGGGGAPWLSLSFPSPCARLLLRDTAAVYLQREQVVEALQPHSSTPAAAGPVPMAAVVGAVRQSSGSIGEAERRRLQTAAVPPSLALQALVAERRRAANAADATYPASTPTPPSIRERFRVDASDPFCLQVVAGVSGRGEPALCLRHLSLVPPLILALATGTFVSSVPAVAMLAPGSALPSTVGH